MPHGDRPALKSADATQRAGARPSSSAFASRLSPQKPHVSPRMAHVLQYDEAMDGGSAHASAAEKSAGETHAAVSRTSKRQEGRACS